LPVLGIVRGKCFPALISTRRCSVFATVVLLISLILSGPVSTIDTTTGSSSTTMTIDSGNPPPQTPPG